MLKCGEMPDGSFVYYMTVIMTRTFSLPGAVLGWKHDGCFFVDGFIACSLPCPLPHPMHGLLWGEYTMNAFLQLLGLHDGNTLGAFSVLGSLHGLRWAGSLPGCMAEDLFSAFFMMGSGYDGDFLVDVVTAWCCCVAGV